jgi:membrane-bound metal-dependent hydrolase YbcI (DUF457 family)
MADFKTHITTSTALGLAYGAAAYHWYDVPWEQCALAAGLCSLAGMLPDLDSDSGVPVRETLCLVAATVPVLLVPRLRSYGLSPEMLVLAGAGIYVLVRFGIGGLFKRYTKHRGMWHSLPAALVAAMTAFLLCLCPDLQIRLFKAWAVFIGFVSHLVLDEIFAVDLGGRRIRIKKSFGSALKFFGPKLWPNISVYAKLVLLSLLILGDARVMQPLGYDPLPIPFTANNLLPPAPRDADDTHWH